VGAYIDIMHTHAYGRKDGQTPHAQRVLPKWHSAKRQAMLRCAKRQLYATRRPPKRAPHLVEGRRVRDVVHDEAAVAAAVKRAAEGAGAEALQAGRVPYLELHRLQRAKEGEGWGY
jgi:hypothetical protein